jgi:hypothetical protein
VVQLEVLGRTACTIVYSGTVPFRCTLTTLVLAPENLYLDSNVEVMNGSSLFMMNSHSPVCRHLHASQLPSQKSSVAAALQPLHSLQTLPSGRAGQAIVRLLKCFRWLHRVLRSLGRDAGALLRLWTLSTCTIAGVGIHELTLKNNGSTRSRLGPGGIR